jgi:hypothetical protein
MNFSFSKCFNSALLLWLDTHFSTFAGSQSWTHTQPAKELKFPSKKLFKGVVCNIYLRNLKPHAYGI